MKSINAWRLSSVAGIGFLICAPTFADENRYAYGGMGFGKSWANVDDEGISTKLLPAYGTTTRDEQDFAWKLFGGYQFNRNFAVEGGYFNLGKFGFTSTVPGGSLKGELALHGINMDLVGTLPFSEHWALLGRVGAQYAETSDTFAGTGSVVVLNPDPRKKELNYKAGVGVQYTVNPFLFLRLEGERYRINDALSNHGDINVASLSVVFPFGRKLATPPPAPVAEPAYVAPPPPTPPPVVAPPMPTPPPVVEPPPRRRVSFSADSLFGFDKSAIRTEGRADLDKFAQEMKGTRFDVITVEGHTDRLGSPAYNNKLSLERAETVKAYLVNAGIDGTKITTVAKGESEPVTKPEDCKGMKRTPQLIACLQPDRRVEVEVVGSRRQ